MFTYYFLVHVPSEAVLHIGSSDPAFSPADLEKRRLRLAAKLELPEAEVATFATADATFSGHAPGALQAVVSGGEVTGIEPNAAWVEPSPSISRAARMQWDKLIDFIVWTHNNPGADQSSARVQLESMMDAAAPGRPRLWEAVNLFTEIIEAAHEQHPGIVGAATWVAFRDGVAGMTPKQLPALREWVQAL